MIAVIVVRYNACADKREEIVAEWGDRHITLEEFRIAYLDVIKKPNVFDSPELREKFLDELTVTRLLAHEAEKRGYYEDEKLRYKAEAFRNKALREAHFDAVIRPKFSISEEDIQVAYLFSREQRKISHLFAKTKPEVDSVYALLKKGRTFEEIAQALFSDTSLAQNGGDLGWVNWDDLEYDLAMTAFKLQADTFSLPVRSQFGYHILKVTDYKKNPLITRAEYDIHRQKVKTKLEIMLGEKYAYDYVNTMMDKADIQLSPEVASYVRSKLKHLFTRKPDRFSPGNEMQLTDDEVKQVEMNLWDMRNEIFATINGKAYTVGKFTGALMYVPYTILYSSFKNAMNYAFRDFLIEQEALELRLEEKDNVTYKYTLFKEYLLQLELRRGIISNVKVTDQEIRDYYERNREKFKGAEFDQVEKMIHDILARKKRSEAVPEFIGQLPETRSLKKYPEIIHRYYNSILTKS